MLIDCDQCVMQRTTACDDCIVTVLIGSNEGVVHLAEAETAALRNLADAGMVAPLRLIPLPDDRDAAAR